MRPVFNFGRHTFSTLYPKIGLEFHVQLMTDEKLFSPSKVSWNSPINTLVSPFDVALPGFLPRQVTKEALKLAVRAALLCGCDIKKESYFDRKHYLNKDLPSGYQITQYRRPFASSGLITLDCLSTRIKCIQLEHDSAKFIRTIVS